MTSGELLRQERINRGKTLAEISTATCISTRYLQAIEVEDLKTLPGDFFYRSFLKQYAQALGLDEQTTARVLASAAPVEPVDPVPALAAAYEVALIERDIRGSNKPRLTVAIGLFAAVITGCSGLYAFWHKKQVQQEMGQESAKMEPVAAASTQAAVVERQSTAGGSHVDKAPEQTLPESAPPAR